MLLKDLTGEQVLAAPEFDIEISGLSADSRSVSQGFLFAALKGAQTDGTRFINAAHEAGAAALLVGADTAVSDLAGLDAELPVIISDDPRHTLALMAARFHGTQPDTVVGVTGTSGKTSVAVFARQIFAAAGHFSASLGTIGTVTSWGAEYGGLTTPDPVSLHETLARLASDGVTHAAMEASSHGIVQRRLDGVQLAAAAFTNLGRDHLDYHGDMEAYLAAKLRLFDTLLDAENPIVVEPDAPYADRVIAIATARGNPLVTVGQGGDDLGLVDIRHDGFAQVLSLDTREGRREVRLPLAGRFQVSNALIAAGLALSIGMDLDTVLEALSALQGAPGRLEVVGESHDGALVFVDYAHKPDALDSALAALRPFTGGRLIVVVGAGGDRDAGKRRLMGEVAARLADVVIVTDDNPRSEDPSAIRAAILEGAPGAVEIADRRDAIEAAIGMLQDGDVLCIAGKGHEPGQIVGDVVLPFSDHEVARHALHAIAESELFAAASEENQDFDLGTDLAAALEMDLSDKSVVPEHGQDGVLAEDDFSADSSEGAVDLDIFEEMLLPSEDDVPADARPEEMSGAFLSPDPDPIPDFEDRLHAVTGDVTADDVASESDQILSETWVGRASGVTKGGAGAATRFGTRVSEPSAAIDLDTDPDRPLWTVSEMAEATGGTLEGVDEADNAIAGLSIDSRTIGAGEAFIAIVGDRFDGHDFASAALEAGAGLAVVARSKRPALPSEGRYLVVEDPLEALRDLARAARARSNARIVAVTGSVGKTGTKEMLKLALDASGQTHAAVASFNNHWGVPLTLARLPVQARFGVFEIGMNHAGEIMPLVKMVRPHVAIITTVAAVHLENFGSVERIAQAKAEIFSGLEPGGLGIINRDNEQFDLLTYLARTAGVRRLASFGREGPADVQAERVSAQIACTSVSGRVFDHDITYKVGAPGQHLVNNSLAVLAAVAELGADLARGALSLAGFHAPKGRGERRSLGVAGGRATVIDESYNANPASMRAALQLLKDTPITRPGRRIAVVGDMLELGAAEQHLHGELIDPIAQADVDLVYCAGKRMRALWDLLPKQVRGAYSEDAASLRPLLLDDVRPGDVIMVKGSAGSRMGPLVEALRQEFPVPDDGTE